MSISTASIASQEGPAFLDEGLDLHPHDRAGREHHRADGRRDAADRQVDDDDQAEVERVDAELGDGRHQDRREQDERRRAFDQHADDDQADVDQQQQQPRLLRQADQELRAARRDALPRHVEAEGARGADDDHHRRRRQHGLDDDRRQRAPAQLAVPERADQQRVHDRHRAGFGRREDPVADADEDEGDDRERTEPVDDGAAELARADAALARRPVAAALGDEVHRDHQRGREQEAGHDAADEEPADRDVGEVAVDDEADAGRDDRRDHGGAGGDRRREAGRVAALDHLRAEHLGLHRGVGVRRGGEAAHQRRQQHVGLAEAADPVADQRVGEVEQAPGDAGVVHDRAGADEERHREQRERVGDLHELLHEDAQRQAFAEDEERQRGDGDGERDRHVDREQHEHQQRGQELHGPSSDAAGIRATRRPRRASAARPRAGRASGARRIARSAPPCRRCRSPPRRR